MSPGIPTRLLATQSDERLLALVRQGHERAFEALVNRYRKPLLGYCRRLLPDARAEDIVQLALLKTWIAVREGAEVRDPKAWLYRVVHNTAVNAVRDAAHDGEPLADPELGLRSRPPVDETQLDRSLAMREALAEVAALPPLQREVIVRTAVAGHSHEQVASDLGITSGAVRGLLYRARVTLRTAITALTPPQLLGWLAGRSDQGGPAPERLAELAGGGGAAGVGGAAGLGGLLFKGGVVAITAGTVITGAAVVRLDGSTHHRDRPKLVATAASAGATDGSPTVAGAQPAARDGDRPAAASRSHRGARRGRRGGGSGAGIHANGGGGSASGSPTAPGARREPRSTVPATGDTHRVAPRAAPPTESPAPDDSTQGSIEIVAAPQGGASGSGSGGPVGTAAGGGSESGSGAGGSSGEGSTEGGSGSQSGTGSGSESSDSQSSSEGSSGSGSSSGSGGSGSSSGAGGSGSSSGAEPASEEHSGSLVGTVVHEVGSILEHLLH
jgi:RNA polymerase sigma factor (sigma-70 family)